MALGTRCLRVARETRRITESHDIRMSEDPWLFRVSIGMMTRVAIVASVAVVLGYMARRATLIAVFEDGDGMIRLVPAFRMWQLHSVTCGTEVRLDVTRRARLTALAADNVGVGGGPWIGLNTPGMVAGVTVAACFPDLRGTVTTHAPSFSRLNEGPYVLILVPADRVRHLESVASVAELFLLVAGRAGGVSTRETDAVAPGPI